jgi:hypothetical protein
MFALLISKVTSGMLLKDLSLFWQNKILEEFFKLNNALVFESAISSALCI